ncbi:MAG: hypothetical protein ACO3RK_08760, partial [Luteolibacter sp.]
MHEHVVRANILALDDLDELESDRHLAQTSARAEKVSVRHSSAQILYPHAPHEPEQIHRVVQSLAPHQLPVRVKIVALVRKLPIIRG